MAEKKKESLEERVKKLKEALDETTEPGFAWEQISEEAVEAPAEYVKKFKGGKRIEEKDYDKALNDRAETYLNALGIKGGKQGKEFYGHMIKTWLSGMGHDGRALLSQLEDAILRGDEVSALSIMQQAYQSNVAAAKRTIVLSDIERSEPDVRESFYKTLAKDLAGVSKEEEGKKQPDYLRVVGLEQLQGAYNDLATKKVRADKYIYKLPEYYKKEEKKKAA